MFSEISPREREGFPPAQKLAYAVGIGEFYARLADSDKTSLSRSGLR